MPTNVAVHTISFRGTAGAIFVCLSLATVLFVIGFSTPSWAEYSVYRRVRHSVAKQGLWESCTCGSAISDNNPDWFKATQAMMVLALICLLLAFILVCIYMCIHTVSKNSTLIALVILCFLAVLFMLIGFCIFGSEANNLTWSFAVSCVAGVFTLVAGILAIVQMRSSGVHL